MTMRWSSASSSISRDSGDAELIMAMERSRVSLSIEAAAPGIRRMTESCEMKRRGLRTFGYDGEMYSRLRCDSTDI